MYHLDQIDQLDDAVDILTLPVLPDLLLELVYDSEGLLIVT